MVDVPARRGQRTLRRPTDDCACLDGIPGSLVIPVAGLKRVQPRKSWICRCRPNVDTTPVSNECTRSDGSADNKDYLGSIGPHVALIGMTPPGGKSMRKTVPSWAAAALFLFAAWACADEPILGYLPPGRRPWTRP